MYTTLNVRVGSLSLNSIVVNSGTELTQKSGTKAIPKPILARSINKSLLLNSTAGRSAERRVGHAC